MPLVSVEGATRLQVTAMVSENNIAAIKKGMAVKVLVKSSNANLTGKVSEVSSSATNTGGQYLVKINLDKTDSSVLSGMFVNVQFPVENAIQTTKTEMVLVPETALVKQGQLTGIYTIGTGNVAILRWLRTGKTFGNQVEVLSGLSANEQYIVSAEGKLYNGFGCNSVIIAPSLRVILNGNATASLFKIVSRSTQRKGFLIHPDYIGALELTCIIQ